MGQYFLCVLSSSIETLSICPGDKGGVDLNSRSIDTEVSVEYCECLNAFIY